MWLETKLVELGMIGSSRNYQVKSVILKQRENFFSL